MRGWLEGKAAVTAGPGSAGLPRTGDPEGGRCAPAGAEGEGAGVGVASRQEAPNPLGLFLSTGGVSELALPALAVVRTAQRAGCTSVCPSAAVVLWLMVS